jgi:4-aminobutyrate aminotransferase-like enzyme
MSADSQLLARRRRVLGRHAPLFYDEPLHIVRGEGVWLFDSANRRYLDVYNNVAHVGHCHPKVVKALCDQASKLNTNIRYLHEKVVEYAERLTATFYPPLSAATLTCTGSEANELALRIARLHTRATGVIVSDFCYHGNSAALAELTTGSAAPEALAPHVRSVPIPDLEAAGGQQDAQALARRHADKVAEAVRSLVGEGFGVAALLVDTVFSSEGLPRVPRGYMEAAVQHVRDAGGLFIADEVQPGFGRLGDHMWGYQAYDVVPDIVTLGKPMGNGHPLAGIVLRPDLLEEFGARGHYFNTFAGNPVSAAVGLAVLNVIEEEALLRNAHEVGAYVQTRLTQLARKHELLGAARGRGLFFGADVVEDRASRRPAPERANAIVNHMRRNGVLISSIGPSDNVLKMRPPMVFSREHADLLLDALDAAIAAT